MFNLTEKLPQIGHITPEEFIREYWQKKPLVIKNGINDHSWFPDINTIAGLALEDFVESRLLIKASGNWSCQTGPLLEDDLVNLPSKDWTLLIQSSDEWLPELKQFIEHYSFLPQWILDDVMTSISAPGGGVGPHVDQYDVFLIQGSGKRRWKIGMPSDSLQEIIVDEQIKQVQSFASIIDVEVTAGDIIYIPPLHPHEGVTLETGTTFSVGFRSPNQQDFLERMLMVMEDQKKGLNYLNLKNIKPQVDSHHINTDSLKELQAFIRDIADDEDLLLDTLGEFASSLKVPIMEEESIPSDGADYFCWNTATRAFCALPSAQKMVLFVNGDSFHLKSYLNVYLDDLVKNRSLALKNIKNETYFVELIEFLSQLQEKGAGYFSPNAH
jgi:50S ribosomal protein L16 3-hydroxylase